MASYWLILARYYTDTLVVLSKYCCDTMDILPQYRFRYPDIHRRIYCKTHRSLASEALSRIVAIPLLSSLSEEEEPFSLSLSLAMESRALQTSHQVSDSLSALQLSAATTSMSACVLGRCRRQGCSINQGLWIWFGFFPGGCRASVSRWE